MNARVLLCWQGISGKRQFRFAGAKDACLFELVSNLQNKFFTEVRAEDLQTNGQSLRRQAAWH